MNELRTMRDLLAHDLQMLYNAEQQALEGLATLEEAATEPQLRAAFAKHGEETKRHAARLEQIMTMLEVKPGREICSAMKGLMTDAEKLLRKESAPAVLDALLLAAAQKVEHFEIACYGTAVRLTDDLGMTQAAELLRQTLDEEKKTDQLLTSIATARVNARAEAAM